MRFLKKNYKKITMEEQNLKTKYIIEIKNEWVI